MTRGPVPKNPATRQRRNVSSTRATLVEGGPRRRIPRLPKREEGRTWHPMTRRWWRAVFQSPMAAEYLDADVQGLYRLAVLVDLFWISPTVYRATAIAQQETKYGLSPIDRRRLEWIVEHAEAEKAQPKRRTHDDGDDPRRFLKAVG